MSPRRPAVARGWDKIKGHAATNASKGAAKGPKRGMGPSTASGGFSGSIRTTPKGGWLGAQLQAPSTRMTLIHPVFVMTNHLLCSPPPGPWCARRRSHALAQADHRLVRAAHALREDEQFAHVRGRELARPVIHIQHVHQLAAHEQREDDGPLPVVPSPQLLEKT